MQYVCPDPIHQQADCGHQRQADQAQGLLVDLFQVQLRLFHFHGFGAAGVFFLFGFALCHGPFVGKPLGCHGEAAHGGGIQNDPQCNQVEAVDHVPGEAYRGVVVTHAGEHDQRERGKNTEGGGQGPHGAAVMTAGVGLRHPGQAYHDGDHGCHHDYQSEPVITELCWPLVTKRHQEGKGDERQAGYQQASPHLMVVFHAPAEMALGDAIGFKQAVEHFEYQP